MQNLRSLLVSWHGELILERYFHGTSPTRPANIKSASKSVISALVGIAIDRKLISSVESSIESFFPELLKTDTDQRKKTITIEDLLTMRSGLESTSSRNYGAWVQSSNWVRYVISRPMESSPGTRMSYSTGNTHLLSAILTKVSNSSTWEFARDTLAKPLDISLARWPRDPQGIYFGGNNMEMTPRQMLAFGELYLNRGRANSKQIIPSEWVDVSIVPRTFSRWSKQLYGYGWWITEFAGQQTFFAWGHGGQFVFVFPGLDLVVVTTSSSNPGRGRHSHLRALYDLVENQIVSPISSATQAISQPSSED